MYKEIEGVVYYTTIEACRMTGISRRTLFLWIEKGIIKDVNKRDWNGYRLFDDKYINELKEFVNSRRVNK